MAAIGRASRSSAAPPAAAGSTSKPLRVRVEINAFASMREYACQKDLFIQAFANVQAKPVDDMKSFYQIAGIHGLPYQSYDNVNGQDPWKPDDVNRAGGYCHHGSPLFPTWHRPYVLLLERAIREEAAKIAAQYPSTVRDEYTEAAELLSLPYWDWASAQTADFGLPKIITSPTYRVRTADSYPKKKELPNPLRAFVLPEDLGSQYQSSDCFNPQARPDYRVPIDNQTPFTPKGYATVRHPNSNYQTQVDAMNQTVQMYANVMFRPNLYTLLDVDKWFPFSNHSAFGTDIEDGAHYGWYTSVEAMHDGVHDAVGGVGGHMTYPDLAGFDPIFFLHHANVDRIIALWQACHPDVWIEGSVKSYKGTFTEEAGTELGAETSLDPFRKEPGTDSACYTSNEVRHVEDLGYTYPELQKNLKSDALLAQLKATYKPDSYMGMRWSLVLKAIPKRAFNGSYTIHVFLDLDHQPTPDHPPFSDPHYVGPISIFARGPTTRCANCLYNEDAKVRARLDITNTMLKLGLDVDQEPPESASGSAIPPITITLKAGISFMVIDKAGQQQDWHPAPNEYAIHRQRKDTTDMTDLVPAGPAPAIGEKRASRGGASGPVDKNIRK